MTLEYIPKISLDEVYNLLPIDYREHTRPADINEFGDASNKELVRKRFYKLKLGESEIVHLTLGKDLKNVFNKTKSFYEECPEYACKPLLISTDQGLDLLGQEFFEGIPIDEKYASNKISDGDVSKIISKIQKTFSSLEVESTHEAFAEELKAFKETILNNDRLHLFDKDFLNNFVFPYLEESLLPQSFSVRWSTGDLAARNILVGDDLNFRIIDCEFAHRTHFHDEDWIRLAVFSSGNFKETPSVKQRLDRVDPWYHIYLCLRQTWLNRTIWQNDEYKHFASEDLYTTLKLTESFGTFNKNDSLLIHGILDASRKSIINISEEKEIRIQKENELDAEREFRLQKENELDAEREFRLQRENELDAEKELRVQKESELDDEKLSKLQKENELDAEKQIRLSKEEELNLKRDKITRMQKSFSWRCTSILRLLRRATIDKYKINFKIKGIKGPQTLGNLTYDKWVEDVDTLSEDYLNHLSRESATFSQKPLISIVMPVFNPNIEYLKQAIQSVIQQTYINWELCITDDASRSNSVIETLKKFSTSDKRIKVSLSKYNNHISTCSNLAASKATGQFIAFLDQDDVIRPHALHFLVKAINSNKEPVLIYSDEDKINEFNRRFSPYFKTDWNPELLRSQNYICHFTAIKTQNFRSIGGFREGFEGSQDWDLFLRATEKLNRGNIIHIPKILYHWRATSVSTAANSNNKDYSIKSAIKALNEHHYRTKSGGTIEKLNTGYFKTKYHSSNDLKSTIIIPTRNGNKVLHRCLSSIYKYTNKSDCEIIIVNNGSDCRKTKNILLNFKNKNKNIFVLEDDSTFNFSALNNNAVKRSNYNIVVFLNDDTEILCNNWLNELMTNAIRPEIGAVGGKLLYPNGTIQHAGVILGVGGVAGHGFRTMARETPEQMNRANIAHNLSAVTGACLAVEKSKFIKVGGFDEKYLKVAFNDVDLCLKLMKEGYENLYLPQVIIKHHESYSRGLEDTQEKQLRFIKETDTMKKRWGKLLLNDPYYNENFSLDSEQFQLTGKPRV